MKYKIYRLVKPEHLQKSELDGYYMKTIKRNVLEELDTKDVEPIHDSMDSALSEIQSKSKLLTNLDLVILPTISINYDGEIVTPY